MTGDHREIYNNAEAAFKSVQQQVLPALGEAWDQSGPTVLLAAGFCVVSLWLEVGGSLEDFIAVAQSAEPPA